MRYIRFSDFIYLIAKSLYLKASFARPVLKQYRFEAKEERAQDITKDHTEE